MYDWLENVTQDFHCPQELGETLENAWRESQSWTRRLLIQVPALQVRHLREEESEASQRLRGVIHAKFASFRRPENR